MMMGNTGEALRKWQAIGERVKRVRRSAGLTTAAFARKVGVSTLNLDLIENLPRCDRALLQKPEALAREMKWDALLERVSNRFDISREWLRTGAGKEPVSAMVKPADKEEDYEFLVSVPLMISSSALLEGTEMIVAASKEGQSGKIKHNAINAWVYHMLTDLFLLYYQGMCAAGRYDVARRTTVAMLNAMEQHSHYDAIAYAMDADRRASGKKQ